jgi:hypothetical protein
MLDVERIIERVREICPAVTIHQLKVLHPGADDDGLWFFSKPESSFEVQIESASGMCPFLIETDESGTRYTAGSVEEAVKTLSTLLHLGKADIGDRF